MTNPALRSEGCTSFPLANPQADAAIYSTAGAERTLAAAGAYERSEIVDVRDARRATLSLAYDPAAIGGYPVIVPLYSNAADQPDAGADSWYRMGITDGAVTTTVLAGALPSGSDFTQNPGVGLIDTRGLAIRPDAAAVAASDEIRDGISLDVSGYRWLMVLIAEVGAVGSPGAALVFCSTST